MIASTPRLALLLAVTLTAVTLTGVAGAQDCLPAKELLPPGNYVPLDDVGVDVAVHAGEVLVGARYDDNGGVSNAGSGLLFDAASTAFVRPLLPGATTVPQAECGTSVDLDGGLAVMGAPYITTDDNFLGTAWIHDVATGAILAELQPSEPGLADRFGQSVGISGDTIVVGAPEDTPGSVWIFDSADGQLRFKWIADQPTPGDQVGWSVDVDGDVAITGALRDSQAGPPLAGAAYLFDVTTGQQLHRLESPTPLSGGSFGRAVAIDGDHALVTGGQGVHLFDVPTGLWLRTFTSPSGVGFGFGRDLALEGDRVVIAQYRSSNSPGTAIGPGSVWVFDAVTGALEAELNADVPSDTDGFAKAVDLDGGVLAVTSGPPTFSFTEIGRIHVIDLDFDGFESVGPGLGGVAGVPTLVGSGDLTPGGSFSVALADGAPSAATFVILGLSNLSAPFRGGVLVPTPDLILSGFATNAGGDLVLPSTWPAAGLGCLPIYAQMWISDGSAPAGYSASNGLLIVGS